MLSAAVGASCLNILTRWWGTSGPCVSLSFHKKHIGKCTQWLLKHHFPARPLCCGFSASQNLAWYQLCQTLDPITLSGLNYFPLKAALRGFGWVALLRMTIKYWKFASSVKTCFSFKGHFIAPTWFHPVSWLLIIFACSIFCVKWVSKVLRHLQVKSVSVVFPPDFTGLVLIPWCLFDSFVLVIPHLFIYGQTRIQFMKSHWLQLNILFPFVSHRLGFDPHLNWFAETRGPKGKNIFTKQIYIYIYILQWIIISMWLLDFFSFLKKGWQKPCVQFQDMAAVSALTF